MRTSLPIIAIVTRETRLEGLKARWATASAAAFRLQQAVEHEVEVRRKRAADEGLDESVDSMLMEFTDAAEALADDQDYESEDRNYQRAVRHLMHELDFGYPIKQIDRTFLPNFDFGRCVLVVVIGPDGLVANTAKYVGDLPIIAVNPDPARNDGVLLPFTIQNVGSAARRVLDRKARVREITLAEANMNDGQRMLAFNEFFVGCSSHVSARYTLEACRQTESQSSSGVIISTGAGSTGWLSSLFNMASGICRFAGEQPPEPIELQWEDRRLMWAVREPFRSKHSSVELVAGFIDQSSELVVGSQMPIGGVIFSDGIESDFLEFNSGSIARFSVSKQRARLVVA
jgi:NAD kinase